jgi:hypothetical protein
MRSLGYYWVKLAERHVADPQEDRWTVGEWNGRDWDLTGSDELYREGREIVAVGPQIVKPEGLV